MEAPRNCLSHALRRAVSEPVYLVLRRTVQDRRKWGHVLTVGPSGLQSYSPGAPLPHPIHAVLGYDGIVWDRDTTDPQPWREGELLWAAWTFTIGTTLWVLKRKARRFLAPIFGGT
jgi:hypothetical protein